MREHIFRAKRKYDGKWVEGNLFVPDLERAETQICMGTAVVRISYDVDPETVGEWTGLVDKNGKKIFEGDILDTPRWVVAYCADLHESLGMDAGWYTQRDNWTSWCNIDCRDYHEVLGNIYDNPELLERI
jgi:uncharacterized phage protein (TIGR01671 family)